MKKPAQSIFWSIAAFIFLSLPALQVSASPGQSPDELFAHDHVIQVEVKMDPDDWHALRISHRVTGEDFSKIVENPYEYYPADIIIDGHELKQVGIRKKGFFGSAISTRPSLKFNLDKFVDDQQYRGMEMLTFNNNNQDATHAQSLLVYKFMIEAGAKSPRSNLGRIIVNGEDLGIYTHVESVRMPLIKRLFKKSKGDLYEGYAGDFTSQEFSRIVHKWGKDNEREKLQQLNDLLQGEDPVQLDEVEKLLNVGAFITFWASEVLIGHWDGYSGNRNNYYLYQEPKSDQFYFIPWGPDSAFWDPGPFIQIEVPKSFKGRGFLCARLWELPEVRSRYRLEMQRLLDEIWNEEQLLADLEMVRSMTREYSTVSNKKVDKGHATITKFVQNRRKEVQAELDVAATDWPDLGGVFSPGAGSMMEVSGEFSSVFKAPEENPGGDESDSPSLFATIPASLLGTGNAKIEYTLDGEPQKPFTTYGVRTTPGNPDFIRKGYPVIEILAASDSGHPEWRVTLILDPHQLVEGKNSLEVDHFSVWARMVQGDPDSGDSQSKGFGISGTLELDEFSHEPGAVVSGRFHLKAAAFSSDSH